MTRAWLVPWLTMAILAAGCDVAVEQAALDRAARREVHDTTVQVDKLAFEAYPMWSAANADALCPATLAELGEPYFDNDMTDSWGHAMHGFCAPMRTGGLVYHVYSDGPDGLGGTADDIRSWMPRRD